MTRHAHLKEHDSIVAVFFASRLAVALLPLAIRAGISPSAVTYASFALVLAAAVVLSAGGSGLLAAVLVVAGFILDCLDGTLARATGRTSDFGRWLDSMTDLVKVYALVVALTVRAAGATDGTTATALGIVALLGYLLCELHTQLARQLPQRSQAEYEATAAPWRARFRLFGQRIDFAFAIGEVLATIALAAAIDQALLGLVVLAVATPVQFGSYAVRFWRLRYVGQRP